MKSTLSITRFLCVLVLAGFVAACEGQRTTQDMAGATISLDDWSPMEVSQMRGNLAEVLSGLPLRDAKFALRNNGVMQHEQVTITGRGVAGS